MQQVQINYERCIGCRHCEIACIIEHSESKDIFKAIQEASLPERMLNIEVSQDGKTYPINCRHCELPLCMNVCPMSAIKKEDEIVAVDPYLCIGCGMCGLACPFGIIRYGIFKGRRIAQKCDGCKERVSFGRIPACVEACKTGALVYMPIEEYEKEKRMEIVSEIRGEENMPDEISLWRNYLAQTSSLR